MNVVIDTNVIVSAVFFGGFPKKLVKYMFDKKFDMFVSPEIVAEYYETYETLHDKYAERGNESFLNEIIDEAKMIFPENDIHICRDPDDDKFISCAVEGRCIYIVSGDKDLLSIGQYGDVQIVKVSDFINLTEQI